MVRPVLAGLRDAGVFSRGYRDLHDLLATKTRSTRPGLRLSLVPGISSWAPPSAPAFAASSSSTPREGDRASKAAWQHVVQEHYHGELTVGPAWVWIKTRNQRSLEGLMKPVIDGLGPFLGQDPHGRLQFVPNDHLIVWLRVSRDMNLDHELVVEAGWYKT